MARLWWGIAHNSQHTWIAPDGTHTTDPKLARRFGTWERADQYLRVNAAEFAGGAWKPQQIPKEWDGKLPRAIR